MSNIFNSAWFWKNEAIRYICVVAYGKSIFSMFNSVWFWKNKAILYVFLIKFDFRYCGLVTSRRIFRLNHYITIISISILVFDYCKELLKYSWYLQTKSSRWSFRRTRHCIIPHWSVNRYMKINIFTKHEWNDWWTDWTNSTIRQNVCVRCTWISLRHLWD